MSVRGYNGCTAPRGRSCFQGRALAPCAHALARAGRDECVRGMSADVALGPSRRAHCAAASRLLCAGSTRDPTIVPKGTCPAGAEMMIYIEIPLTPTALNQRRALRAHNGHRGETQSPKLNNPRSNTFVNRHAARVPGNTAALFNLAIPMRRWTTL